MISSPRRSSFKALPTQRRRYNNPYFQSRTSDRFIASTAKSIAARISPRGWLYGIILLVLVGALTWLGYFSTFTRINRIDIRGADNHDPLELERLGWRQTEEQRALFFSQEQLLAFKSDDLRQEIERRYAFEDISISKRFPSTLRITVKEKASVGIWFEADAYYHIDRAGWVIAPVPGPVRGETVIYNNGDPKLDGKKISNSEQAIEAATYLAAELPIRLGNLNLRQLVVDNEQNTLKVIFSPNVIVFIATDSPVAPQLDRLEVLVKQELKDTFKKLNYVDLRYGEKVYYK